MFSKTKAGWTPLHYVAFKGYNELIKTLVTKHNGAIDATSMVSGSDHNHIVEEKKNARHYW